MFFHSLEITNFRGIKAFKAEDLKDINLFVGNNNSGKTSVLEALFLLLGASNPELLLRINGFRDLFISDEDDLRLVFYNLDYSKNIQIQAETNEKSGLKSLEIQPTSGATSFKKSNTRIENPNEQLSYDTNHSEKTINELKLIFSVKESQATPKKFYSNLVINQGRVTIKESKTYSGQLRGVYVTPKIHLTTNLEKTLENLIIHKKHNEIIDVLKVVDKNITNITFGTNRKIYFDIGIDRLIPINLAGDGIRRILAVILSIYNARDGVVLIDEIENGLHFSTLKPLWNAIFTATQKFNVQLFTTTHNIETLKYLKEAVEDNSSKEFANKVRSYTLRKLKDGNIKSYKYNFEKFEFSLEQGIEIR